MPRLGRIRLWQAVCALAKPAPGGPLVFPGTADLNTTSVLERLADGVAVVDVTNRLLWANQAFLDLYGLQSVAQSSGLSMEDILQRAWNGVADGGALDECLQLLKDQQHFVGAPFELKLPNAQFVRVVEKRGEADGRGYFIHADITRLKQQQAKLAKTEERYRLLAEYSQDIILYVVGGTVTYASPALTEFLGWDTETVIGQPIGKFCHPGDAARVADQLRQLGERQEADYRARVRHRDGTYVWIEARARKLPQHEAGSLHLVINARPINARKAFEDELERAKLRLQELAMTDGLTGLANRRKLDEVLDLEFRRSQREGNPLALLVLDIDYFKNLNDLHGHQVGDAVLRRMASILTTFPNRAGDLAARLGGEEFVLLLPGANYHQALAMAERVRETVQATRFDPPVNVAVTVSIGVASVDIGSKDSANSPEGLVGLADGALYAAKRAGRNRVMAA